MFPAILIPMAIGALAGAATNRKDPWKGALMGAGMGAVGGVAAPAVGGLLGGGAAASGAAGAAGAGAATGTATGAAMGAATEPVASMALGEAATAGMAQGAATEPVSSLATGQPGLWDSLKKAGETFKPITQAAGSANQAYGLLAPQEAPVQASPLSPAVGTGNQTLLALAQQPSEAMQQVQKADEARRARRRGLLGVA